MKKILTLLVILFGVSLVGGLYHTFAHIDKVGDYTYTEKFAPEMPEINIDTPALMPRY